MSLNTSHLFGLIRLGARLSAQLSGFPDKSAQVVRLPEAASAVLLLLEQHNSSVTVAPTDAATDQTQVPKS